MNEEPKVLKKSDENSPPMEDPAQSGKRLVTEEVLKNPAMAILIGTGQSFLGLAYRGKATWQTSRGRR